MNEWVNSEKSEALSDALYNVIYGYADPGKSGDHTYDNSTIFDALIAMVTLFVVGSTEADNIDIVAAAIGEEIAKRAHRLHRTQ